MFKYIPILKQCKTEWSVMRQWEQVLPCGVEQRLCCLWLRLVFHQQLTTRGNIHVWHPELKQWVLKDNVIFFKTYVKQDQFKHEFIWYLEFSPQNSLISLILQFCGQPGELCLLIIFMMSLLSHKKIIDEFALNPLYAETATKSLFTCIWDQMDGSVFHKFLMYEECDSIVVFKKVNPGNKIRICLLC